MDSQVLSRYREYLSSSYADYLHRRGLDSTVDRAIGACIRDHRGCDYVDFVAGYGVFSLGHNPPRILATLHSELDSLPLWNRPFLSAPLAELAARLVELTPAGLNRAFICSTGSEAVESAIKLARLATRRPEIVAAKGSFHGFTLGALSVSGIPTQSRPFRPLLPGVHHVPFGDVDALSAAVSDDTAAVLLEPIQAEIGAVTPPAGYLAAAREICHRAGVVLIVDEVRTGIGRTGPLLAIEHEHIIPDMLILGKSLAGGIVSIGALIAQERLWGRFGLSFAMSASSFAGNRLACVSALAALAMVINEDVLEKGQLAAAVLWKGLTELASGYPDLVLRLTGKGMLVGVHLHNSRIAREVVRRAIHKGLLIDTAFLDHRCILIEPPLIISPVEVRRGLELLHEGLAEATALPREKRKRIQRDNGVDTR